MKVVQSGILPGMTRAEIKAQKAAKDKADRIEKASKEWMESTDKKTGQKYWYNVETSETTWDNPFK